MKITPQKNNSPKEASNTGLVTLRDAINHLFDESLWNAQGLFSRPSALDSFFPGATPLNPLSALNALQVDFSESEHEYAIVADVPGFSADDLEVELKDRILVISGHKIDSKDTKEKTYHLQERSESQIKRSLVLPDNCNLESIKCDIKDGILRITVPKEKESKGRRIKLHQE
jgi:HSP20 family protein